MCRMPQKRTSFFTFSQIVKTPPIAGFRGLGFRVHSWVRATTKLGSCRRCLTSPAIDLHDTVVPCSFEFLPSLLTRSMLFAVCISLKPKP